MKRNKKPGRIRRAKEFAYSGYRFDPDRGQANFDYQVIFSDGEQENFTERVVWPQLPRQKNIPAPLLAELLTGAHLMLGVSY